MERYAKHISAIAVILVTVISLSGCGIVDYARSLVKKDPVPVTDSVTINGTTGTTSNSTSPTSSASATKPNTTSASTSATTKANQSTPGTEQTKPQNTTDDTTLAPKPQMPDVDEDNLTEDDIKEMPVKDVQDLLFATDDENTASKILKVAGFEYDEKQGIYYSQMNPLQRKFGFNFIYDTAAPIAGMIYDTKRIEFEYGGKEWMIQLWKGQYGMTAGAEIGLYSRDPDRVMQYDCADDSELITMQFDFYNQGEYVFSRGPEKHWWLTGFKVLHIGVPMFITMDMNLDFEDNLMANAFQKALKDVARDSLIDPIEYERRGSKFHIVW